MKDELERKRIVTQEAASAAPRLDCPQVRRSVDVGGCAGCRFYRGLAMSEGSCSVRCTYELPLVARRIAV